MPTEPIDIRVYSPSGSIDTSLIGTLSIYNQTTATFDISNVSIPYSSILQTYHYNFTTYNELHVYIGMVDFGASALTRYSIFLLHGSKGLSPSQATQLANTVKTGDTILNLDDILIPI